jgi:hypothetical protein
VPEAELDDLTLTRVQPVHGGADKPAQFGPLSVTAGVGGPAGWNGRLIEARFPRAQPPVAFAAGHRVKPGPQPARIGETAEVAGRDDERVLDGVGGTVRFPSIQPQ